MSNLFWTCDPCVSQGTCFDGCGLTWFAGLIFLLVGMGIFLLLLPFIYSAYEKGKKEREEKMSPDKMKEFMENFDLGWGEDYYSIAKVTFEREIMEAQDK